MSVTGRSRRPIRATWNLRQLAGPVKPKAEITSLEFPGERLVACSNPLLAEQRRQERQDLLVATRAELETLAAYVT